MRGTVVTWLAEEGHGYIKPDGGKGDIFVHYMATQDLIHLEIGQRVQFKKHQGRDGKLRALDVEVCTVTISEQHRNG